MMTSEPSAVSADGAISTFDRFVRDPLFGLWDDLVAHLPAVITAVVVLVSLWIAARVLRVAVQKVLAVTKLDAALEDTRLSAVLAAFNEGLKPSLAVAYLAYFAVLLLAWMTAADIVGLTAVRATLDGVLGYLPRLVSALLVISLGGYLASLARRAVAAVFKEVRSPYSRLLESFTELALLVIVGTLAINVLGVDMSLVTQNLTILIATVAITVAFLFAWSMRRPAGEIIANYYLRRMVGVGDVVEMSGKRGIVAGFSAIGVILRADDGSDHFLPARDVLDGFSRPERASPDTVRKLTERKPGATG